MSSVRRDNFSRERDEVELRLMGRVITFAVLLVVALVENAFGHVAALAGHAPRLTLVAVFILTLFHAPTLGLWAIFFAGLAFDLTEGNPPGYSSALMVLTHLWVIKRRMELFADETGRLWNEFIVIAAIVMGAGFCAVVAYTQHIPAIQPLLLQCGLTILSFPIALWFYHVAAGFMAVVGRRT